MRIPFHPRVHQRYLYRRPTLTNMEGVEGGLLDDDGLGRWKGFKKVSQAARKVAKVVATPIIAPTAILAQAVAPGTKVAQTLQKGMAVKVSPQQARRILEAGALVTGAVVAGPALLAAGSSALKAAPLLSRFIPGGAAPADQIPAELTEPPGAITAAPEMAAPSVQEPSAAAPAASPAWSIDMSALGKTAQQYGMTAMQLYQAYQKGTAPADAPHPATMAVAPGTPGSAPNPLAQAPSGLAKLAIPAAIGAALLLLNM